jgi:RNA polymerase sigma-70 factor (ECF subfamily)
VRTNGFRAFWLDSPIGLPTSKLDIGLDAMSVSKESDCKSDILANRPAHLLSTSGQLSISESTAEKYTLADPDVRLMLQVRDGDAQAFEELMLRYQNRLMSLLAHLIGQRDLAEDLTQEVFLRVYRARKRYVPGAKFSTWLFTIAGNVASNALRSKSRRREVHLAPRASDSAPQSLEAAAVAASGLMPTRQLDKAEMCAAVQQAVAGLNERQRMAVLLAKFEHFSYADIGAVMDMTPQAVKSLLSRARCNLRQTLQPYLDRGALINNGELAESVADSQETSLE